MEEIFCKFDEFLIKISKCFKEFFFFLINSLRIVVYCKFVKTFSKERND